MPRDHFTGVSEHAKASAHRLDDAWALLKEQRWRGAMYLAGYAVECLLKSKLMRKYGCLHLRALDDELQRRGFLAADSTARTHQLEKLLELAGAVDRLRKDVALRKLLNIVNQWIPGWRYSPLLGAAAEAQAFVSSVERIRLWIDHNV
jgi:HEPN domain-containing protein